MMLGKRYFTKIYTANGVEDGINRRIRPKGKIKRTDTRSLPNAFRTGID
jgi:hypothetical protein